MDEARLNKSISMLESVLNTPQKGLLRSSRFVAKTARKSISKSIYEDAMMDIHPADLSSLTLAPHELSNIMGHTQAFHEPNLSLTETLLNGNTLKSDEKAVEILEKLYLDFYEMTQLKESIQLVFQTMAEYIQSCTDILDLVTNVQSKRLGHTRESAIEGNRWLEKERNIWRLIYCLYQDRLTANPNPEIELIPPNILTEKQCVENLYKTDSLVRECQLVIDWLEKNASDQVGSNIGHYTDTTIHWENSFKQIVEGSNSIVFPSTRPIITHLDPDASIRENKPLHDLDVEDEKRLCREIFNEIRCGRLNEAQDLCVHCGQPWRAAILEGWRLFHDPNFWTANPGEKFPIEGNPKRDLWKRYVFEICEDQRLDKYWQATLGVLSGNLKPILAVCVTWSDYLWAYLKVMVDIRVETEIRDTVLNKKYKPMPEAYWRSRFSLDEIFGKLPDNPNEKSFVIQRLIIMDQPKDLLKVMKEWVEADDLSDRNMRTTDPQFLRMLSHIVLLFREMGLSGNESSGDAVLEKYVEILVNTGRKEYVAFYTSLLPQNVQIKIYSNFLENIKDTAERKAMLHNAELVSLDIEAITKHLVETIRSKDMHFDISDLSNEVTPSDQTKISAIDWLLFYETQRLEALKQTNALIRYFLACGKLDAARQAFNKIPNDCVDSVLSNYDDNSVPPKIQNIVKEFLCYRAYLEGNENFTDWFCHFHNAKPKAPAPLPERAGFADKVAHEHRVSQYNAEYERWKLTMEHKTQNAKVILYNILLFPEGGWLVDACESADDSRSVQLKELRALLVPKVVFLLHTVMHSSGEYKECIQLADLIADESKQLYQIFNKHALSEILHKIGQSSMALMDQKKDPWGYDVGT